jgi:hypothetical protein
MMNLMRSDRAATPRRRDEGATNVELRYREF